jgi:hypothetical protein
MSSTNRFSPETDTASTNYKSTQTSIYSPRTKRSLKKIKRSSFANPAWKSTSDYARNPKIGRTFITICYSNLWKPRGREFQRGEICDVFELLIFSSHIAFPFPQPQLPLPIYNYTSGTILTLPSQTPSLTSLFPIHIPITQLSNLSGYLFL